MTEPTRYSYRTDPRVPDFDDTQLLFVFDGECVLCSGATRFLLRHDDKRVFRFATAQSPLGAALYAHYGLAARDYETNLVIEGGALRIKSDGSIRLFEMLGPPWSLVGVLRIVPLPLLDKAYAFVARNRLRILGKRDACYLPSADERERFLA